MSNNLLLRFTIHSCACIFILFLGCSSGSQKIASGTPPVQGPGASAPPTASLPTVSFPATQVGTSSAPQMLSIVSASGAAISVKSALPSIFLLPGTSTCAANAAQCQIQISFQPSAVGPVTSQLTISDSNGQSILVVLSGIGLAPLIAPTATPSQINFGRQAIGKASAVQILTVTSQNGDAISALSSNPIVFPLSSVGCSSGTALCRIGVSFNPGSSGPVTVQISLTDSNGLSVAVAATGTGFVPAAPAVGPLSLDFGNQEIGIPSAPQILTVLPQNADAVRAALASMGDFSANVDASCSTGSNICQIQIVFNPSTNGAIKTSLVVTDTTNSLATTISLVGTGYGNTGAMAGLAYYLPFTEGSGNIIQDVSGNGKNATIAGSGVHAVWGSTAGLQLNGQTAVIPRSAGLPTFGYCAYFPAATAYNGATLSHYSYVFSNAAAGQNGYNIGGSYGVGTNHGPYADFPQIGRSNGDSLTRSLIGISGNHCLQAVVGDSSSGAHDKIFIDGVEVSYLSRGITDDTLGNSQLKNSLNLQAGDPGFRLPITLYSVWGAAARDTSDQALARAKSEIARLKGLGVLFVFADIDDTDSSCSITGTSLDVGLFASYPPSALLNLDFPCTIHNFAVSGQAPADMAAGYEDREATVYHPKAAKNIAFNGGPTNGLVPYQESPARAFQDLVDWNTLAHSQGWKTLAETETSRCDLPGYMGESGDALKHQYNELLLAHADLFDWVINQAAVPQLGADNACANPTYFTDSVHFTDAGQSFYVASERAGFEGVYRTLSTPIATDYTQIASDSLLIASGAKPFTISLMDANTGNFNKSGRVCMSNTGSGTVTLQAIQGQTIGGSASLPVLSGSGVCFKPYVADPSVGGAIWLITD